MFRGYLKSLVTAAVIFIALTVAVGGLLIYGAVQLFQLLWG